MKNLNLSYLSTSALSLLLCASVISSCGSSKDSKTSTPTIGSTASRTGTGQPTVIDAAPTSGAPPVTGASTTPASGQTTTDDNSAPVGTSNNPGNINSNEPAAPVGKQSIPDRTSEKSGSVAKGNAKSKVSAPDFNESTAIKTGGKLADLNYTSASDDGLMELFRTKATGVPKEQQVMNQKLAAAITGAKLKKNGSNMNLDLALNEFDKTKVYSMKAVSDGNKLKLSLISATGDLEFQGGYVKCLDDSCDNAYAKIKLSGAYTRIIFRTSYMDNNFAVQADVQDSNFLIWKSYILNTVGLSATDAKILTVQASSYEVLNGKSAMGIQLLTKNNQAVSFNTLLLAPETGTELNQEVSKWTDLSVNYNLPTSAGKLPALSQAISSVHLVNNNGKGQLKLKLTFGQDAGSIWMTLSKIAKPSMTPAQVQTFESKIPMW